MTTKTFSIFPTESLDVKTLDKINNEIFALGNINDIRITTGSIKVTINAFNHPDFEDTMYDDLEQKIKTVIGRHCTR